MVADGIAVISITGALMKQRASFSRATSTALLRRSIRSAAADRDIRGIMMVIDSPGGTVAGTGDLADDIAAAAGQKPVHAFFEDLAASAAYWVGSQANHVSANPTALVGSIGTFAVVHDLSKAADDAGIKVHVIKAGEFKGAGAPGSVVTDDQLAQMQIMVDGLNEHFLDGVASGRGMNRAQVNQLNDGRVHIAATAQELNLIDAVESFAAAFDRLDQQTANQKRSVLAMQTNATTNTPVADNKPTNEKEPTNEKDKPANEKDKPQRKKQADRRR